MSAHAAQRIAADSLKTARLRKTPLWVGLICLGLAGMALGVGVVRRPVTLTVVGVGEKSLSQARVLAGEETYRSDANGEVEIPRFLDETELTITHPDYQTTHSSAPDPWRWWVEPVVRLTPVEYTQLRLTLDPEQVETIAGELDSILIDGQPLSWTQEGNTLVSTQLPVRERVTLQVDIPGFSPRTDTHEVGFGQWPIPLSLEENRRHTIVVRNWQNNAPLAGVTSAYAVAEEGSNRAGELALEFLQADRGALTLTKSGFGPLTLEKENLQAEYFLVPSDKKVVYPKLRGEDPFDLNLMVADADGANEELVAESVAAVGVFGERVYYVVDEGEVGGELRYGRYDTRTGESQDLGTFPHSQYLGGRGNYLDQEAHLYAASLVRHRFNNGNLFTTQETLEVENFESGVTHTVRSRAFGPGHSESLRDLVLSRDGQKIAYLHSKFVSSGGSRRHTLVLKVVNVGSGEVYLEREFADTGNYPYVQGFSHDSAHLVFDTGVERVALNLATKAQTPVPSLGLTGVGVPGSESGAELVTRYSGEARELGSFDFETGVYTTLYNDAPVRHYFPNGEHLYVRLGDTEWHYFDGQGLKPVQIRPNFTPLQYFWHTYDGHARGFDGGFEDYVR